MTMTELTEQWKKGELPEAWYYVKNIHNKEILDRYFKETDNFEYLEDWEIAEILAPVPSYKWVINHSFKRFSQRLFEKTLEENAQLKELLKECELWFTGIVGNMNDKNVGEHNRSLPIGNFEHIFKEFSRKIDEAIK